MSGQSRSAPGAGIARDWAVVPARAPGPIYGSDRRLGWCEVGRVRWEETMTERLGPWRIYRRTFGRGTEEQYQSMLTAVHPPGGLPEGQSSHVAGPTDGGYLN